MYHITKYICFWLLGIRYWIWLPKKTGTYLEAGFHPISTAFFVFPSYNFENAHYVHYLNLDQAEL